jgi:DivIVA domain-containing protein
VTLLLLLLTLAVIGVVVAVATGVIAGGLDEPASSIPARGLPEGPVAASDLDGLRFTPALRGYRIDQVEAVLDRLREEVARRDDELTRAGADLAVREQELAQQREELDRRMEELERLRGTAAPGTVADRDEGADAGADQGAG